MVDVPISWAPLLKADWRSCNFSGGSVVYKERWWYSAIRVCAATELVGTHCSRQQPPPHDNVASSLSTDKRPTKNLGCRCPSLINMFEWQTEKWFKKKSIHPACKFYVSMCPEQKKCYDKPQSYQSSSGRAIAQAVSRWLPTAAARVRARVWSSGICGGQNGAGAGFLFIPPSSPAW
jgi:(2Fe-2S) ferredoxin